MHVRLDKIWNNPKRTPVLVGLIAFTVGGGLGYILGQRKNTIKVIPNPETPLKFNADGQLNEETLEKIKSKEDVEIIKAKDIIVVRPEPKEDPIELVTRNIFPDTDDEWNYVEELKKRSRDEPYIIHKDEFFGEEENGYTQKVYTYYAGDDILVDTDDSPIYNHSQVVGELRFGHGSGDPTVVYVRNDKRHEEYEVNYDTGLYSTEVLGIEIEHNERAADVRHSRNRKVRQGEDE